MVASLPHSGLYVPPAVSRLFTPEHRAWLRNTDWFLPEVYRFLPGLGVTVLEATHSRYVADLNRDPGGVLHGEFSRAVIARTTAHRTPIYSDPDAPGDFAGRIPAYHAPYHAALRETLDETIRTFGRALLLDLHSFMGPIRNDACIGDCHGAACTPALADRLESALRDQGFDVVRNTPFAGGYIVRTYGKPPRCEAVQLEIRYTTYLDCSRIDEPGRPTLDPARIAAVQTRLRPALEQVIAAFVER